MLNTYGISLYAYHGVYLGVQWMFRITDGAGFWDCHGGPMDGRLLFSREWNKPWQIPSRQFVIPRGRKGEWDWGMICGIANRPVASPKGDEWWYYYGGWDFGHGTSKRRACIGIAKLRIDGFASITSVDTEGVLKTPKLRFAGSTLKLNIDATGQDTEGKKNYVLVALLDNSGRALKGYSEDDSDPIHVDDVDRVVTWKGNGDVSNLAGQEIIVVIHMKGAELYALQFAE